VASIKQFLNGFKFHALAHGLSEALSDGRQFITITAGDAVFTFALPQTSGTAGRSRGR
jgi:hypothetical protein